MLVTLLMTFTAQISLAQIKAFITDSISRERIPYVNIWLEDENTGTTSNENGEFEMNVMDTNKILVFSAIGYESTTIKLRNIGKEVKLVPKITVLNEVFIRPKTGTKLLSIDGFKKSETNSYFVNAGTPWIVAKFFEYKSGYSSTPFLKSIIILTDSRIKNAYFNIRLYSINEKGEPGDLLQDKNIIAIARKGKTSTVIDLSAFNIKFPENGFFIACEWLIIESNRHEYTYTNKGSKKKLKAIRYEPAIAILNGGENRTSWTLTKGNWKKWKGPALRNHARYQSLAIELILTN